MQKSSFYIIIFITLVLLISCKDNLFVEGKRIYEAYCSNCHMDDGSGLGTLIPPLAGADYLAANKEVLPCIISNGQEGPIIVNGTTYNRPMPAAELSDIQLLNLINYITNNWGNDLGYTTIDEVKQWNSNCTE